MSKAGVTLTHNGGKLTGSLGNMAAGEVIIVTILADVKATATGMLMNEAEVSARTRSTCSNNRDEVENAGDAEDRPADRQDRQQGPGQAGRDLHLHVTVKNNGPSNATGVRIIDTLPLAGDVPERLAAEREHDGRRRWHVRHRQPGGRGDGRGSTITVQVERRRHGHALEPHRGVRQRGGNHLPNNEDDEPTIVKIDPATIDGNVYVDKDNDGVFDAGERPLAGVTLTLTGNDFTGARCRGRPMTERGRPLQVRGTCCPGSTT